MKKRVSKAKIGQYLQRPAVYIPAAVLCCVLWASAFPVIKRGYAYFHIAPEDYAAQILFAGCRFALAGLLVILLGSLIARKPLVPRRGKTCAHIGILAVVQTVVQYGLFYFSLAKIEGSAGSVLNAAGTFFCVLLSAAVFLEDRMHWKKALGCALGLLGIVVLHFKNLHLAFHLTGEGFMLLSAASHAASAVLIKKFSANDSPALLSGWQFFLGGCAMAAIGALCGGKLSTFTPAGGASIAYLALVSAVAYTLWSILLKYNAVSKIAVFGFIIPIGGVVLSALLLGEQVDIARSAICLALVSAGVVMVNSNLSACRQIN